MEREKTGAEKGREKRRKAEECGGERDKDKEGERSRGEREEGRERDTACHLAAVLAILAEESDFE